MQVSDAKLTANHRLVLVVQSCSLQLQELEQNLNTLSEVIYPQTKLLVTPSAPNSPSSSFLIHQQQAQPARDRRGDSSCSAAAACRGGGRAMGGEMPALSLQRGDDGRRGLYLEMEEGWQECGRATRRAAQTKFNKDTFKFSLKLHSLEFRPELPNISITHKLLH